MSEKESGTGPNPVVFRLVWGAVALVAVGSVYVVWDAYQTQVEKNQAGIFDGAAQEAARDLALFDLKTAEQCRMWARFRGRAGKPHC